MTSIIICVRHDEVPVPYVASLVRRCSDCNALLWLSRQSLAVIPEGTLPICRSCSKGYETKDVRLILP